MARDNAKSVEASSAAREPGFLRMTGETGVELRARLRNDPTFAHLFRMVYSTIASGEVTATDWRDAVNLAFSEWHARNVSPILVRPFEEDDRG